MEDEGGGERGDGEKGGGETEEGKGVTGEYSQFTCNVPVTFSLSIADSAVLYTVIISETVLYLRNLCKTVN